jgi:glycosyltransferase involved in cell wall biosynthesis
MLLWHGYLLDGTGSNVYTQQIARALGRLGHDVRVICQEPHPARFDLGPRVRVVRPDVGGLLPVFVLDRYEDIEARHVGDMTRPELELYTRANAACIERELAREPAGLVLANHAIMGGPVAAAGCASSATPYAVKLHGSELEYAIRDRPHLAELARPGLDRAVAVLAGSQHILDVASELLGPGPYLGRALVLPPGVDTEAFTPAAGSLDALAELLRRDPGRGERHPDEDAGDRLRGLGRFVLYVGKLMREKGVHVLLDAWRALQTEHPDVSLVVVGFGDARAELEELAPPRTIFTGAMSHAQLQRLVPLAEVLAVPSVIPEAFGMVAAEAASCGVLPVVSDHSGLAELAAGLGEAGRSFDGSAASLARELDAVLRLAPPERRRLGEIARAAVVERWSWTGIARRLVELVPVQNGTRRRGSPRDDPS